MLSKRCIWNGCMCGHNGYRYNKKTDCYLNPLHLVRTKIYKLVTCVLMPTRNLVKNQVWDHFWLIFICLFCLFGHRVL